MGLRVSQLEAVEVAEAELEREAIDMMSKVSAAVSCCRIGAKIFLPGKWM